MTAVQQLALQYAKEIVVSKVAHSPDYTDNIRGNDVADYFGAIYNKIYEIASKEEEA